MNLLLLTEGDRVPGSDRFRVEGRRAQHLTTVLRAAIGQTVRAGLLDGPQVTARVVSVVGDAVELEVEAREPIPPRPLDTLVLAVPRPKVLRRMLATAATLGFGRIHLTRSWKVEKSHLASRVLAEPQLGDALRDGLEQGRRTRLPEVRVHARFTAMLEELGAQDVPGERWLAHPGAHAAGPRAPAPGPHAHAAGPHAPAPFALALGPDGGWIDRELTSLGDLGFRPFGFGDHPLRTETALAVAWGQLDYRRRAD